MTTVKVTIIEEVSSNKFIMKCQRCEGSGCGYNEYSKRSTVACKVCNGRGVVLVEVEGNLPFVKCQRCDGTGRGYTDYGKRSTEPCTYCLGIGAQPVSGTMKIIP
jgi:DnaJ-class molecular chaperone